MNKSTLLMFLTLMFVAISCGHDYCSRKDFVSLREAELNLVDSVELELDSCCIPQVNYLKYSYESSLLSFVNPYNNSIYVYDYNNGKLCDIIDLDSLSGGLAIQGYHIENQMLYAYSYNKGILFAADMASGAVSKAIMHVKQDFRSNCIYPYPYLTTISPLVKHRDFIVSVGYASGESTRETDDNRPVMTILNLKSKDLQVIVNYPELYSKYDWGGTMTYRLPYYCLNEHGDYVISFPACHQLVSGNLNGSRQSTIVESGCNAIKEIKPYRKYKFIMNHSSDDVWSWYMNNPSYEGILYDKYRKVYYRFARLPLPEYKKGDRGNRKPLVVIILDENLQYLGEYLMPTVVEYFSTNAFVSERGLNIQVISDNEDVLQFYVYEYE